MSNINPASSARVNPVGFTDLSGKDMAKIIGIKVAKVAIAVLSAAAIATAVWFLAPITIPAGIFIFGGSIAGLIGGGALLSTIEAVAFKKLNQWEDDIYKTHSETSVKLRVNLKDKIQYQVENEADDGTPIDQKMQKDMNRGFKVSFDGKSITNAQELLELELDEEARKIVSSTSRQLIESVLQDALTMLENMEDLSSKSLLTKTLFKEIQMVQACTVEFQEKDFALNTLTVSNTPTDIVHDSQQRKTTVTTYCMIVNPQEWGQKGPKTVGYIKISCVLNWDSYDAKISVEKMKRKDLPLIHYTESLKDPESEAG